MCQYLHYSATECQEFNELRKNIVIVNVNLQRVVNLNVSRVVAKILGQDLTSANVLICGW